MESERDDFEKWARSQGWPCDKSPHDGRYYDRDAKLTWLAWQARAAPSPSSPAAPALAPVPTAPGPGVADVERVYAPVPTATPAQPSAARDDTWALLRECAAMLDASRVFPSIEDRADLIERIDAALAAPGQSPAAHPSTMPDDFDWNPPAPDDKPTRDVLLYALRCAKAWEPNVRIHGNLRACDLSRALTDVLATPTVAARPASEDKGLLGHVAAMLSAWDRMQETTGDENTDATTTYLRELRFLRGAVKSC